MKKFIYLIILLLIIATWAFPIIISVIKNDYWFILLYFIWWLPASLFTGLLTRISDAI
jgi:hypothetical protein